MKLQIRPIAAWLVIFFPLSGAGKELGHSYQFFREDLWQVEWSTGAFLSDGNFSSSGGAFETLPEDNNIFVMDSQVAATYGITNHWNVWGQGGLGYVQTEDSENIRSNSGLSFVEAGTSFRLYRHPLFEMVPVARLRFPLSRVSRGVDEAIFTEGSLDLEGLILIQNRTGPLRSHGFVGLRYRDEGRSALLPWGVGTEFWLGRLAFGGTLGGFQSITMDEYTTRPEARHDHLDEVNAGSLLYYSVEPSVLQAGAWARYAFNRSFMVRAGLAHNLNGENYGTGTRFFAQLHFYFWPVTGRVAPIDSEFSNFRIGTDDGVDQRLFESPRDDLIEDRKRDRSRTIEDNLELIDKTLENM